MALIWVKPDGRRAGSGATPTSALDLDSAIQAMTTGDRLIFLPGRYEREKTIDASTLSNITMYGNGKVIFDGLSKADPMIRAGTEMTVTGIRFVNCISPIEVPDGKSQVLVFNCFDVVLDNAIEGRSFHAGDVSAATFKNLTTRRANGEGISVLTGTSLLDCLSNSKMAYFGEIVSRFENNKNWRGEGTNFNMVIAPFTGEFIEGEQSLYLGATNKSGASNRVNFRKLGINWDLSRADTFYLVMKVLDDSGLPSAADAVHITLKSAGGAVTFDLPDTDFPEGWLSLALDIDSPTSSTGSFDESSVTEIQISPTVLDDDDFLFLLDHAYLLDSTVDASHNGVPTVDGDNVFSHFRGVGGIDTTAKPPVFENPSKENFKYDDEGADLVDYLTLGKEGLPVGAIWQGSHAFTPEPPGHLKFTDHVIIGPWENDETFWDSDTQSPGPEGEGLSAVLNESGATVTGLTGTINVAATTVEENLRDLDDATAYTFEKSSGAETVAGVNVELAAPYDADAVSGIGIAGELKLTQAILDDVVAPGMQIIVESPGGSITGSLEASELVPDWNEVEVLFASPDSETGTFDPSDIVRVKIQVNVNTGVALTGFVFDHLSTTVVQGPSTGPIIFDGDGRGSIDLSSFPESDVGRLISSPFHIRNAGPFLRAFWQAVERADLGSFVNFRAFKQFLQTRAVEVRWSELKFSRYGTLQGSLAKDWTPVSRLIPADLKSIRGKDLWVEFRATLRNRVIETEA